MSTEAPYYWQIVLEAFVQSPEPMNWALPGLKVEKFARYEATMYLVEKGLIKPAGHTRMGDYGRDQLYQVTDSGVFVYNTIKGTMKPRLGKLTHEGSTLAQRVAERSPVTVFELAAKPWTWDQKNEQLDQFGEEYATLSEEPIYRRETFREHALAPWTPWTAGRASPHLSEE